MSTILSGNVVEKKELLKYVQATINCNILTRPILLLLLLYDVCDAVGAPRWSHYRLVPFRLQRYNKSRRSCGRQTASIILRYYCRCVLPE